MRGAEGKRIYRRRAMGECINARFRNWGLYQFTVRGLQKVNTVLRLYALANNILAGHRLLRTGAPASSPNHSGPYPGDPDPLTPPPLPIPIPIPFQPSQPHRHGLTT